MGKMLVMVVLGTWLGLAGAGGVAYFLVKSGKIPVVASASEGREEKATRTVMLEPILANLADAGGHAYVRLGLRVEIAGDAGGGDAAAGTGGEGKEAGGSENKSEGKSASKSENGSESKSEDKSKGAANGGGNSASELDSSIRDTVLAVLGRQSSADLLGPDGKEHLKIELREAIERGAVRVDVKQVFFTDFLVQI